MIRLPPPWPGGAAGTVQQRLRNLPSGVGVRFLLAMCLFPEVGYRRVWDKMTWAFPGLRHAPSTKGLRDPSRRVGCAPATSLFAERA
ncbi:transposase domain-containing protein [Streptomyces sp. NPDC048665]|uniref:transposase domain-containing protein n=1 Tax=Streptomyces sp. NPDC048665 TaxID=3155490 RepID=UPI00342E9F67